MRLVKIGVSGVSVKIGDFTGNAARLIIVEKFIDQARTSELIAHAIKSSGLVGVDVAPPGPRKP